VQDSERIAIKLQARVLMSVSIRAARVGDAADLGRICYEAFAKVAATHGFTADFPNSQIAAGAISAMLGHEGFYGVVS
jgi:hypothetical protein